MLQVLGKWNGMGLLVTPFTIIRSIVVGPNYHKLIELNWELTSVSVNLTNHFSDF